MEPLRDICLSSKAHGKIGLEIFSTFYTLKMKTTAIKYMTQLFIMRKQDLKRENSDF